MLGRKTSLLEDASQVLKDFQAVSEVEPARDRAKSFSRQASSIIVFFVCFLPHKGEKSKFNSEASSTLNILGICVLTIYVAGQHWQHRRWGSKEEQHIQSDAKQGVSGQG